jgi:hypothetical protein
MGTVTVYLCLLIFRHPGCRRIGSVRGRLGQNDFERIYREDSQAARWQAQIHGDFPHLENLGTSYNGPKIRRNWL